MWTFLSRLNRFSASCLYPGLQLTCPLFLSQSLKNRPDKQQQREESPKKIIPQPSPKRPASPSSPARRKLRKTTGKQPQYGEDDGDQGGPSDRTPPSGSRRKPKTGGTASKSSTRGTAPEPKTAEVQAVKYPLPKSLKKEVNKNASIKRCFFTYRCPYCIKKAYTEPHLLLSHVEADHQDALEMEAGDALEKWTACYWRFENLTRKSVRACEPERLLQHFASFKTLWTEEQKPHLWKALCEGVTLAAAELSTRLTDETVPSPLSVSGHKSLIEKLKNSKAYFDKSEENFPFYPNKL